MDAADVIEITVQRRTGESAPVVVDYVEHSGLPVRKEGRLDLAAETLRAQITPSDYGRTLGRALFRDDVRDAFANALARASKRLHVLLFVEDEQLARWHWERLCAPADGAWDFLSLNQRTPFSLYLPSATDRRFPPIGRRDLRGLIIAANPSDPRKQFRLPDFDVARAVAGARAALGDIPHIVLADPAAVPDAAGPPTLDALAARITAEPITLLHFICHGRVADTGETVIYLANEQGGVAPVSASMLIDRLRLLHGTRGLPRFAFLETCESAAPEAAASLGGLGQRLVRDLGMPAVVAMTERVSVTTADALAATFYPRLREHGQPDLALAEACAGLAGRCDITVPAFYSRLRGRPLFSDTLDRQLVDLTNEEIRFGLARLADLMQQRAPILRPEFDAQAATLQKTLDTDPAGLSPATREEREQALAEVDALCGETLEMRFVALALGREPPLYDDRCPFQGLVAFDHARRAFFFGREKLIELLRGRLAEHNFLAVLGPSGSGKSSLVMAGLIPALERQHPGLCWSVIKPGDDMPPSAAGNPQSANGSSKSLLIVDQFEELFTLTRDDAARRAFIDRLLALSEQHHVVLTMRADFWGDCAPYPALKAEMQAHQELIPPMDLAELRSAMEQQAQVVDLRFEADLANTLLDDVAGEPGAMPLLQHALLELWKRRHGGWLRAEEYRNLGGVRQAIARTADGIYNAEPSAEQRRMRDIFLRLTRLDEDAVADAERRDTRRRVPFADLVPAGFDPEPTRQLVKKLADARLVVTSVDAASGQQEVEIAHEALIRYWKRLEGWLNEDRDALRLRQNLNEDAREWDQGGRADTLLPRWNARLEEAQVLARRGDLILSSLERNYLDAAIALREWEIAAARKRQRVIVGAAIVALALAVLASVFAIEWRRNANTAAIREAESQAASTRAVASEGTAVAERATAQAASSQAIAEARKRAIAEADAIARQTIAEREARRARAGELAVYAQNAIVNNKHDPSLALLLAIQAVEVTLSAPEHSVEANAHRALRGAVDAVSPYMTFPRDRHTDRMTSAAYSPDGRTIVTASTDNTARIWDAATGQELHQLTGHTERVWSAANSPDGKTIVTASGDNTTRIWDAATGRELRQFTGHSRGVKELPGPWTPDDDVNSAAYSPDGKTIVTASDDDTARIWDAATGQELRQLAGHTDNVNSAAYSPDGKTIVTASDDDTARIWDAATGQELGQLAGHTDDVESAAYSPDGKTIVTASRDTTARIWDAATGQELRQPGHTESVLSAAYSPDGRSVVTVSDGAAFIWIDDINDLLRQARRLIQRDLPALTPEELRRYGLEQGDTNATQLP